MIEQNEKLYDEIKLFLRQKYIDLTRCRFDEILRLPDWYEEGIENEQALQEKLDDMQEGFVSTLLRKIDEKGIKDSECYKRANIDKRLFSKMRKNMNYKPKKQTVLAFVIALEMTLEEAQDFLKTAGYSLSRSDKADVIVEFFITKQRYDIFEVNNALYYYNQPLLGSKTY
ncbi:MAG: hypothetical protein E7381_05510 [Clostridiales bacterium]|nr:hypothetical protein [Clostridiales bacterium]